MMSGLFLLALVALLLPPIALLVAISARTAATDNKLRLTEIEATLAALRQEIARLSPRGAESSSAAPSPAPRPTKIAAPLPMPPRPMTPREIINAKPPPKPASVPRVVATPAQSSAKSQSDSFERTLGTRWAVWAGGLALALGGLFLVRYTIEAGLLGPGVRVILGLLLSSALVVAGEWFRRGEIHIPIEALPHAHIPSILTASGTVVAFGSIYAAHALYGFIGSALAFTSLGAVGIATMLAAALHGPALAGLGLAGSFIAPLLVESATPSPWPVVLYLAVVAAAGYILARTRRWLWLAKAALAGAFVWGLMLLDIRGAGTLFGLPAAAIHALIQLGLGAFFLAVEPHAGGKDAHAKIDRIATAAIAVMTTLAVFVVAGIGEDIAAKTFFSVAAIAILAASAWRTAPAAAGFSLAGLIAIAVILVWPNLNVPPSVTLLAPWAEHLLRLPDNVSSFLSFAAFATLLPAAAAAYRIWRGALLPPPIAALYGLGATVPPLLALVLAYLRVTQFDTSIPFAASAVALAAAFAVAAEKFHRADIDYSSPAYNVAAGILAAAAIAAFAFALTAALERGYLTVALALTAFGTAYVATLRDIPALRHVVTALGVVVLARIAWNPRIMGADLGTTPLFNWLLLGYGVPALSFWGAARLLERRGDMLAVRISDGLAIIFTWLFAVFQIRHALNGGDVLRPASSFLEAGLMTLTAIGLSYALARLDLKKSNPVFSIASLALGALSIAIAAFGLLIAVNPLFTGDTVAGATVLSTLLPAYLLPGIAALFVARNTRHIRPEWYVRGIAVLGVVLITAYISLEVRHAFQGSTIGLARWTSAPEHWAHSFAWLVLGMAFLAYGLVRKSLEARIASAVLIVMAAAKITLFDLAGIGGFWRAFSFICLGAVLIGIGLVYQKIVFAPERPAPEA